MCVRVRLVGEGEGACRQPTKLHLNEKRNECVVHSPKYRVEKIKFETKYVRLCAGVDFECSGCMCEMKFTRSKIDTIKN